MGVGVRVLEEGGQNSNDSNRKLQLIITHTHKTNQIHTCEEHTLIVPLLSYLIYPIASSSSAARGACAPLAHAHTHTRRAPIIISKNNVLSFLDDKN